MAKLSLDDRLNQIEEKYLRSLSEKTKDWATKSGIISSIMIQEKSCM